jgi:Protein of unknown function (DUF3016)
MEVVMSVFRRLLVLILGSLIAPVSAVAGLAEVTFVDPAKYADAGPLGRQRDANLAVLEAHVKQLAAKHLAPGQTLRLEFLDVDLAGNERPWRGVGADVRVLRGRADWPRLSLRYSLRGAGQAGLDATESISDMNYLGRVTSRAASEPLAHEKRLLDEWFQTRFVAGTARR